jgi:hypothetical protein
VLGGSGAQRSSCALGTWGEPEAGKAMSSTASQFDQFRPCVRWLFDPASREAKSVRRNLSTLDSVLELRRAIVGEARRIGMPEGEAAQLLARLFELHHCALGDGLLRSKVVNYTEWGYGRERLPSRCATVRSRHPWLCGAYRHLPERPCPFEDAVRQAKNRTRSLQRQQDTFDDGPWPEYLRRQHVLGPLAATLYRMLRRIMVERDLDYSETIFVGLRVLEKKCKAEEGDRIGWRSVAKALKLLEDYELLAVAEKGKRGKHSREANGYRLCLPTPECPQVVSHTAPISHMYPAPGASDAPAEASGALGPLADYSPAPGLDIETTPERSQEVTAIERSAG